MEFSLLPSSSTNVIGSLGADPATFTDLLEDAASAEAEEDRELAPWLSPWLATALPAGPLTTILSGAHVGVADMPPVAVRVGVRVAGPVVLVRVGVLVLAQGTAGRKISMVFVDAVGA